MDAASAIILSLKKIGIDTEEEMKDDTDLRNYIKDSITFISFVIELEINFDIELPYEMLLNEKLASFKGFCIMLDGLASDEKNNRIR